jgi:hypothetical protein
LEDVETTRIDLVFNKEINEPKKIFDFIFFFFVVGKKREKIPVFYAFMLFAPRKETIFIVVGIEVGSVCD